MSDRVAHAVAAATGCARSLGLTVVEPRVLHDGVNIVVRLGPAPVVARVATLTPLLRPEVDRAFGREVELARALTAVGAPVVPPSDLVPPGPHQHAGRCVSFWRLEDLQPGDPDATTVGRSLGELHAALADVRPPDGTLLDTPLADLDTFVQVGEGLGTDPAQVAAVAALVDRLRPELVGGTGALHGDAHPGNLLHTARGLLWSDLEDTTPGPVAWDLACLRSTRRLDGAAAVRATPWPLSDAELAPFLSLRALHAAVWWQVLAVGDPGYRFAADERLRDAVAAVSARPARPRPGPR